MTLHLEVHNRFLIIKSSLFILFTDKAALVRSGERLVIRSYSNVHQRGHAQQISRLFLQLLEMLTLSHVKLRLVRHWTQLLTYFQYYFATKAKGSIDSVMSQAKPG